MPVNANQRLFTPDRTGMYSNQIISAAAHYSKNILLQDGVCRRPFHNIHHTEAVVKKCEELVSYYELPSLEKYAVIMAAWFHDTGYSLGNRCHERSSVRIAMQFLSEHKQPEIYNQMIEDLIMSTCLNADPKTPGERILRDCDLHHLGSVDYPDWSGRLQMELKDYFGLDLTDDAWNRENIHFLNTHQFFTEYAETNWSDQKHRNLQELMAKVGV